MFKSFHYKSPEPRPEDLENQKLGQKIHLVNSIEELLEKAKDGDFVILGYADDRGVHRNGGRLGACEGPTAFREVFYNFSSYVLDGTNQNIFDLGDLNTWSIQLREAHDYARETISKIKTKNLRLITVGGGHDWAFSDYADFKGALINLDAHFDVRPNPESASRIGHSGTPFRNIQSQKARSEHPLIVIGAQKSSNSREHEDWLHKHRGYALFADDLSLDLGEQWNEIKNFIDSKIKSQDLAVSIDMDVFSQCFVPGVSAPSSIGLNPAVARELIRHYGKKIKHLGIYELNPRVDRDKCSARVAAQFALTLIDH